MCRGRVTPSWRTAHVWYRLAHGPCGPTTAGGTERAMPGAGPAPLPNGVEAHATGRAVSCAMAQGIAIGRLRLSPDGDLLEVDGRATEILGIPGESGAGHPCALAIKEWMRVQGVPRGPTSFEHVWDRPGGGTGRARLLALPHVDDAGRVRSFDVYVDDVQASVEAQAQRHRQFLAAVLEALPNPVFAKDEAHRWVLLNDSYCRFMGYDRDQLIGKSDHDFFPKSEADVFWAKDDAVFATGELNENEESFTDSAGRAHVILTRKTPLREPSGRRYLIGVITDITERKQMEDELRRSRDELDRRVSERTAELRKANEQLRAEDRRKTEFLAILGHELRNPLTPIRNAAYALRKLIPPGGAAERPLAIVERQVAQMTRLIDDLLDVARITRGKVLLKESRFDLVRLVEAAIDDHAAAVEVKGLQLEKQIPHSPMLMVGDPARVAQAVENLLDNARKFTECGGKVTVRLEADPAARTATISVRDTGMGIPQALLPHLFEAFSQPAESLRRGGLGLGLAVVKGLVELHRGTVEARSEGPGAGAEFILHLPLDVQGAAERPRPAPRHDPARRRILVIEDNEDAAESLALVLEMASQEVTVARTGEEGVETARALRPDVVLSDVALGSGMTGYDVARALRAVPDLASTRLVAVTGYGQEDDRRRAIEAGFDEHLVKPFDIDGLFALLDRLAARPLDGAPAPAGSGKA